MMTEQQPELPIDETGREVLQGEGEYIPEPEEQVVEEQPVEPEADIKDADLILGKFKSQEELMQAYQELEKKIGETKEEPEAEPTEEKAEAPLTNDAQIPNLSQAQIDQVRSEIVESGAVSAESYAMLEKQGYSRHMVDAYLAGNQAVVQDVLTSIGGTEGFNQASEWAKTNMDPGEIDVLNSMLSSGNLTQMKMAVRQLDSAYKSANGKEPSLIKAQPERGLTNVYESQAQVIADMQTDAYKTDPAFRRSVQAKLARSKNLLM